jgi:hypothetical protein
MTLTKRKILDSLRKTIYKHDNKFNFNNQLKATVWIEIQVSIQRKAPLKSPTKMSTGSRQSSQTSNQVAPHSETMQLHR